MFAGPFCLFVGFSTPRMKKVGSTALIFKPTLHGVLKSLQLAQAPHEVSREAV